MWVKRNMPDRPPRGLLIMNGTQTHSSCFPFLRDEELACDILFMSILFMSEPPHCHVVYFDAFLSPDCVYLFQCVFIHLVSAWVHTDMWWQVSRLLVRCRWQVAAVDHFQGQRFRTNTRPHEGPLLFLLC